MQPFAEVAYVKRSAKWIESEADARGADSADVSRPSRGKALRLPEDLVSRAEQQSAVARRSVPKQIEYWAQLGQLLESSLSATDIHSLLSGEKFVASARLANCVVPDANAVLRELEAARQGGTLNVSLEKPEATYDIADDGETLRRTTPDGRTELGTFVDGQFVAQSV